MYAVFSKFIVAEIESVHNSFQDAQDRLNDLALKEYNELTSMGVRATYEECRNQFYIDQYNGD